MPLYGGIALHANNRVVVLLNAQDQVLYQRRFATHLPTILEAFAPYQAALTGVVVESTYNWDWLVDGLMAADDRVHLAHPAALQQDNGRQYTDDHSNARWLVHVLRLGVWPEGYIYPKAERAVRDTVRQRAHLVRQQTANGLSLHHIIGRNTGGRLSAKRRHEFTQDERHSLRPAADQGLAVTSSLAVLACLRQQSKILAHAVRQRLRHSAADAQRLTVEGSGTIFAPTMVLETGSMGRFPTVGNSASYCRGVQSSKRSHGQRKGQGNVNNGHPYLEGASREAAQFALRCSPTVQQFSQRKQAKRHLMVARTAVAQKLAWACYSSMRDVMPVDVHTAFGCGRAIGWVEGGDGEEIWFTTRRLMRPDLTPC